MRKIFCERLKELRSANGLTQKQLAEKLGLQRHNISDYEQGRTEPDLNTLVEIAKFFDVPSDYLLGLVDGY